MKVLGIFIEKTVSQKSQVEYARFCTTGTFENILINTEYIRDSLELLPSHTYVIDVLPFYSSSQDRAFLGYRVLSEADY